MYFINSLYLHISICNLIGAVVSASLGENSTRAQVDDESMGFNGFSLRARGANSEILADIFASVSLSAQHGNFQRLFFDLTRVYTRLDFPSGSKFLSGATRLANDFYNSKAPCMEAVQAVCPNATLSVQQQVCALIKLSISLVVSLTNTARLGWCLFLPINVEWKSIQCENI